MQGVVNIAMFCVLSTPITNTSVFPSDLYRCNIYITKVICVVNVHSCHFISVSLGRKMTKEHHWIM